MGGFDEFLFDEKVFNKEPGDTPTVTTQAVTDFIGTTAKGHGTIEDIGSENCSKRGVCWNISGLPTVNNSKSEETNSFGVGAFERLMTELSWGQMYYVKAYAYNIAGYGYGGQVRFGRHRNIFAEVKTSRQT